MNNQKEKIFFLKRLSFMLSAGHTMHQSLIILKDSRDNKVSKALQLVIDDVASGGRVSESLRAHKFLSEHFILQLISLGEKTGNLAALVKQASEELERKRIFYSRIFGALLYPMVVVSGTLLVSLSLFFFIFPKVLPIFTSLSLDLPFATKVLMWSISICIQYWYLVVVVGVGTLYGLYSLFKKYCWKFSFVKYFFLTQSLRVVGLVTKAGLALDQAFLFASETLRQKEYKKAFLTFSREVREGKSLGELFASQPTLFPVIVSTFIKVAQESGNLSEAFTYLSDFYAEELSTFTKRMTDLIEPILMILLGLGIAFIGLALISPIYGLTSHIYN